MEFWWWIEPLWLTGLITVLVITPIAVLLDKAKPYNRISVVLAVLAILPFAICALSLFACLIINALILIWR